MTHVGVSNVKVTFVVVSRGVGVGHKGNRMCPDRVGALVVLGMVSWAAAVLRRRFDKSAPISKARILLHAILGTQLLLGFGALLSDATAATVRAAMEASCTKDIRNWAAETLGLTLFAKRKLAFASATKTG